MEVPEVRYDVVEPERKDLLREIVVVGRLRPILRADLFFRYQGGRLIEINVRAGDTVRTGELVASLDVGSLSNQRAQREVLLRKAQVRLEKLELSGADKFDLELGRLDMRLAELQLEEVQTRYVNARLVSPIDGLVTYVDAEEGDYVDAFRTVVTVVDPSRLVLECEGDDTRAFPFGVEVDVKIGGAPYTGRVVLSPQDAPEDADADEPNPLQVQVIGLAPEDAEMNTLGTARWVQDRAEDVIVLPTRVVHRYAGRDYVNVLVDGLKEEREVSTGIRTSREVEITSGLDGDELVIAR